MGSVRATCPRIFNRRHPASWLNYARRFRCKPLALPGNHLEALKGGRKGQHSIRINRQWRVCFRWTAEGAEDVEIVDYH